MQREEGANACDAELAVVLAELPEEQQRAVHRAVTHKTGAWLSAMPTARNGKKLCAVQWRDGIALRYAKEPTGLQPRCDGCGEDFAAHQRGGDSSTTAQQHHTRLVDHAAPTLRTHEEGKELKHKNACEATSA